MQRKNNFLTFGLFFFRFLIPYIHFDLCPRRVTRESYIFVFFISKSLRRSLSPSLPLKYLFLSPFSRPVPFSLTLTLYTLHFIFSSLISLFLTHAHTYIHTHAQEHTPKHHSFPFPVFFCTLTLFVIFFNFSRFLSLYQLSLSRYLTISPPCLSIRFVGLYRFITSKCRHWPKTHIHTYTIEQSSDHDRDKTFQLFKKKAIPSKG